MLAAAAQLHAGPDWRRNLEEARRALDQATREGARLIVLPELFMAWKPGIPTGESVQSLAQPIDGPFVTALSNAAREAGLWVVCGMVETSDQGDLPYNTTVVLDDAGRLITQYRKTHLFDAFNWRESETIRPGDTLFEPVDTPLGRIGLMVCYELRFPEVARYLTDRGAEILVVPSAWVAGPGKEAQWRVLTVARAIENTVFVIAADQTGTGFTGASLIGDPMGVTLTDAGNDERVVCADINLDRLVEAREKVPSLRHRRRELYQRVPSVV